MPRKSEGALLVVQRILDGVKEMYGKLMESPAMTQELKAQGFTFDISKKLWSSNKVMVIEMNDFGVYIIGLGMQNYCMDWRRKWNSAYPYKAQ